MPLEERSQIRVPEHRGEQLISLPQDMTATLGPTIIQPSIREPARSLTQSQWGRDMSALVEANRSAAEIAAKATGLRPDQVAQAVAEYRAAVAQLHEEPDWQAICHMSSAEFGIAQYHNPTGATAVTLQVDSWKERGEWKSVRHFACRQKLYEFYGEARAIELQERASFKPYAVDS